MNSLNNQYDFSFDGGSHSTIFFPFNIDYQMAITPHTIRIKDIRQYLETNSFIMLLVFLCLILDKCKNP